MKQFILSLIILMAAITSASSKTLISGESNTFLQEYKVIQINNNNYELTYSNSPEKFIIEVCPDENKCCYLVRNPKIEVMYLCNENGFGLRKMPLEQRKLATSDYCDLINCKTFMYQSLMTPNKKDTKDALGLIACFFPEVINESSRGIVFDPVKGVEGSKLAVQD